jgi:hypothetical protein
MLALTMIDPAKYWFKIVKSPNESATFTQDLFHNTWLPRYLQPQFIVFDNGDQVELIMSSNKDVTFIGLKPNQLQITTKITSANEMIYQSIICLDQLTWKTNVKI